MFQPNGGQLVFIYSTIFSYESTRYFCSHILLPFVHLTL